MIPYPEPGLKSVGLGRTLYLLGLILETLSLGNGVLPLAAK